MARPRGSPPTYEELFASEKARELDRIARAIAGHEGRPAFSRRASASLEDDAWSYTDPAVTPEHLAQIAEATVRQLAQDRDETGQPRWSLEQIDQEVRYQQSIAMHPYRSLPYTTGVSEDDYEAHARIAERIARRTAGASPSDWSEPIEESDALDGSAGEEQRYGEGQA